MAMRSLSSKIYLSLGWTLGSSLVAWIVVQGGFAIDVMRLGGEGGYYQPQVVHAIPLMVMFAGAMMGLGSLVGERIAIHAASENPNSFGAARAAAGLARTFAVIAVLVSFVATAVLFLSAFSDSPSAEISIIRRLLETYIPIVGYTALAIWIILSLFVFRRGRLTPPDVEAKLKQRKSSASTALTTSGEANAHPRSLALAFILPIVALAVGLVIGLIVYDLTNRGPEATIWLLIAAIVGSGVIAGSVFAARAIATETDPSGSGASHAATLLSFVLSIVFSAVVTVMSVSYGQSAIQALQAQPYLSTYAGNEGADGVIWVNGDDLKSYSTITLDGAPGITDLESPTVDADGYFYGPVGLPEDLPVGTYEVNATATGIAGQELATASRFDVSDDGTITPKDDSSSYTQGEPGLITPDLNWWLNKMLPAFGMLLVAEFVLAATLVARHSRRDVTPAKSNAEN